ncbi:MAG: glycosyltransferase family A protein, partial [Candidatus Eisenbacteria bacterium]
MTAIMVTPSYPEPAAVPPRFSVIVPTLGSEDGLRAAFAALAAQSFPRERFEVIVAFDGVAPSATIAAACAAAGARVVHLDLRRGPGAARNTAAAVARGEIFAFTEDDCVPDRDWLANAARR